jgi:hypothetical protein
MSRASIHKIIRDGAIAIQDPQFNLLDFLNSFPAQVNKKNFHQIIFYVSFRSVYLVFKCYGLVIPK